jgi:hypothetical protein
MRLVNKVQPLLKIYDEKRNELVKEFGEEPDKDGNIKVSDPEKFKLFSAKMKELLEVDEDIDWTPIKIEELGNVEIAPKLLLNFLFENV